MSCSRDFDLKMNILAGREPGDQAAKSGSEIGGFTT
jgi:hypothetical protein